MMRSRKDVKRRRMFCEWSIEKGQKNAKSLMGRHYITLQAKGIECEGLGAAIVSVRIRKEGGKWESGSVISRML